MKLFFFISSVICLLGLTGCVSNPVVRTETIVIMPPETLMTEVVPEPPPNISDYTSMSNSDKEDILTELLRKQTQKVETCNSQLSSIRKWGIETMKLKNNLNEE